MLFAISDLHLSLSVPKPMDVFGGEWENYVEKIKKNWLDNVCENDTVVLCGDLSWGISLSESLSDFLFVENLPGKKIILKGNHDYFWETVKKMNAFFSQNGINSINILHNNCYFYDDIAICGTRGWFFDQKADEQDEKIFKRELGRLEASLLCAKKDGRDEIYAFLHYPPLYKGYMCAEIIDMLKKYGVKKCISGHLHGPSLKNMIDGTHDGIEYIGTSADFLHFRPIRLA